MNNQARFVDLENGQYIVTDRSATQAPVQMRLAEKRAFLVGAHDLPASAQVYVPDVVAKVRQLKGQVASQFVGRGELVDMATLAIIGGDHAFVQSPPGTGKSRIFRLLAEGMGGKFWAINMSRDTTREMLVGPPSISAIREERWDRHWNGLATCTVALIDEIWESNAAVTTLLKPILEERVVEEAGVSRQAPLLSAFAASNFVPEDHRQAADWDRWLYRLPIEYMSAAASMRDLAYAMAGSVPLEPLLSPQEVLALNAYVDWLGLNPPEGLVNSWLELWGHIRSKGYVVSDRRWKRLLRSAQAQALMDGADEPTGEHLAPARWMFWNDPDEYAPLRKEVLGLTDPVASDVLDIERLAEALRERAANIESMDWESRAKLGTATDRVLNKVKKVEQAGADAYAERIKAVKTLCERVEADVVQLWRKSGGSGSSDGDLEITF